MTQPEEGQGSPPAAPDGGSMVLRVVVGLFAPDRLSIVLKVVVGLLLLVPIAAVVLGHYEVASLKEELQPDRPLFTLIITDLLVAILLATNQLASPPPRWMSFLYLLWCTILIVASIGAAFHLRFAVQIFNEHIGFRISKDYPLFLYLTIILIVFHGFYFTRSK
jgi:hypothetical protein